MDRAARVSGSRFGYIVGDTALVEQAIFRLAVERLVEQGRLIAGTPAECAALIERLQGALGFTLLCCMFQFGGIDFPTAHRSMELFAREVAPRLGHEELV
jgi:alkanesulfonate monooxygenase SsuD/methylene tetrahydromethanopterin reductase-like flavin-dependent oxidoreductase (luciferase family)